jgi:hypothetical protein
VSDTIRKLREALCALWTHDDIFVRRSSDPDALASLARVRDMVRDALRATEGRAHPSWGDWGHFNNAASGTREPSAATGQCGPGCQRYGAACPPKPPGFRPTECSEFVPAGAGGEKVEVVPNCATCRVVVEHDRMRKEHDALLHQRDAALKANEKYVQEARRLLSERDRAVVPLVDLAAKLGVEGFTDKALDQAYRLVPLLEQLIVERDSWRLESGRWKKEAEDAKANAMRWEKEVAEWRTALETAKGQKA